MRQPVRHAGMAIFAERDENAALIIGVLAPNHISKRLQSHGPSKAGGLRYAASGRYIPNRHRLLLFVCDEELEHDLHSGVEEDAVAKAPTPFRSHGAV